MSKLKRVAAAALMAGVGVMGIEAVEHVARALAIEACVPTADGCLAREGATWLQPAPEITSDDFDGPDLAAMWSVEGPGGEVSLGRAAGEAYVELVVPSGDFDPWQVNRSVRLLQAAADEDFGVEARFLSTPTARHQIQGILVEQDADNWLRFDTYSDGNKQSVFAGATANGESSQKIKETIATGSAGYLRVERSGGSWALKYSADGQAWTKAGSFDQALNVRAVGPFAGATSSAPGYTAQVDYFVNSAAGEDGKIGNVVPMVQDDVAATEQDPPVVRDGGNAAAKHNGQPVALASVGALARESDCERPATERKEIPEHLRALTATAIRAEGPSGIAVDFVAHPLPPHEGHPWSHWGEGLVASNGRYYTAIGDHLGAEGDSYLYEYDPATRELRAVGDVLEAYGAHRQGDWGYGKVHGQISEGPCGQLYFHTYWGTRRGIEDSGSYAGDLLMRYNPAAQELESLGVQLLEMGSPSTQMWRAGGLFYGEANYPAGKTRPWPVGKLFWVYDIARGEVVFKSPKLVDRSSGRDIAVDRDGRAYYSGAGRELLRYDPATNVEAPIASFPFDGGLRASSEPAPDGKIFMTTNKGSDYLAYLFDPDTLELDELASLPGDTADLAISASGEVAYFTPGAHGQGRALGFPLMEIDRSGNIRTVVELGPIIHAAGGPYPAGTYSYSVDPDNPGDIYILANAGPRGTDEKFGQPLVIVVHLPESERR